MTKRFLAFLIGFLLLASIAYGGTTHVIGSGITSGGGTVEAELEAQHDDYYVIPSTTTYSSENGTYIMCGEAGAANNPVHAGLRFKFNVPQGATITAAYIETECAQSYTANMSFDIRAHDVDNSAQITDYAGWNTAHGTMTDAKVDWQFSNPVLDEVYHTSDISTVVQEIVDREGWNPNQYIQFFIDNDGSTNYDYYKFDAHTSGDNPAMLHVEYTP